MAPKKRPLIDRLMDRVEITDGCWLWTGSKIKKGYGSISGVEGKTVMAHRLSYTLHVGPIPDGMYVMHRCDTPACVRPDHLVLGSPRDNVADMYSKGRDVSSNRTHCAHGHLLDEQNTYVQRGRWRRCRKCVARYQREYKARQS